MRCHGERRPCGPESTRGAVPGNVTWTAIRARECDPGLTAALGAAQAAATGRGQAIADELRRRTSATQVLDHRARTTLASALISQALVWNLESAFVMRALWGYSASTNKTADSRLPRARLVSVESRGRGAS